MFNQHLLFVSKVTVAMDKYHFKVITYIVQYGLVLGKCQHAQPVSQIFQQWPVREVGHSLVTPQQYLDVPETYNLHLISAFWGHAGITRQELISTIANIKCLDIAGLQHCSNVHTSLDVHGIRPNVFYMYMLILTWSYVEQELPRSPRWKGQDQEKVDPLSRVKLLRYFKGKYHTQNSTLIKCFVHVLTDSKH